MAVLAALIFLTLSSYVCDVSALSNRVYVKNLKVNNGGGWGTWKFKDFCARGTYAIGYKLKIEEKQGRGDDTSLNGVQLVCGSPEGISNGGLATSEAGPWGDWRGQERCSPGDVMVGFKLQVERWQRRGDDTAANFMKIRCRGLHSSGSGYEKYIGNGKGYWGSYGSWSPTCSAHSGVCGLRTKIEKPIGRGDDTALNDVELYCCNA